MHHASDVEDDLLTNSSNGFDVGRNIGNNQ